MEKSFISLQPKKALKNTFNKCCSFFCFFLELDNKKFNKLFFREATSNISNNEQYNDEYVEICKNMHHYHHVEFMEYKTE